jgi:hypothetical protein
LSISSSSTTGFFTLAFFMACIDAAGERADVGAAVAADLGLVAHAAEGDAHEGAARRVGDRLPERGLADAGRAREAQDGARLLPESLSTAMCSRMRFFTSSRPKWSASSFSATASRSSSASARALHGRSAIHSR